MGKNSKKSELNKKEIYLTALAYASVALVVVFMIFIYVPDPILYARRGPMKWLAFLLIFGALPYAIFKALNIFYPKHSFLLAVGMLLFVGPLFGVQLTRFDRLALERDGQIAAGAISKKFQFKPSNRDPEWMVQATFEVNGRSYVTFPQKVEEDQYVEGMEVEVVYSHRNPDINMLMDMLH
ncbi:MAG: hypothetical protein HC819_16300 [Cyclobacteriaceae bacterium]|nr:hypothetical protein [Cyclobacteriaceae bacterium]